MPGIADWMEQESRHQGLSAGSSQLSLIASEDGGSLSSLRALVAAEALGDLWEGFGRPRTRVEGLAESLASSWSLN